MSRQNRVFAMAAAICLLALFAISSRLTPDPAGLGTHQQLGLPPCSMRLIFGIPCPACGMTTSWSFFVRGQFWSSFSASPAGCLLAGVCCVAAVTLVRVSITGRPVGRRHQWALVAGLLTVGVVAIVVWGFRVIPLVN